ncbi:MAG TPA: hypothetical protein VIL46_02420, partial [Gemmataceae bacterium]
MHLRTTIALIVLAAGGGVAYWKGEEIGARLGLGEARQAAPDAGTLSVLRERITGENLARVEVRAPGNEPVVLASTPSGPGWALPGNWPVREPEVRELVNLLAGLESRFEPIPLGGESPDLEPYGLAESQKPVVVDVTLREGEKYRLRFGRPEAGPGRNPFAVPTY